MTKLGRWHRVLGGALPVLAAVACGESERSSNADGSGAGASSGSGGSAGSGAGGGAATGAVGTAWFEVIEPLPVVVEPGTEPSAIINETTLIGSSLDGSVLSGSSWLLVMQGNVQQNSAGFRWTRETGMVDLGDPGGVEPDSRFITPSTLSHDGTVVVGSSGPGLIAPIFRWTEASGMVDIGDLEGAAGTTLDDVSADGSVVVGTSGERAFRWTAEKGLAALGAISGMERSSSLMLSGDGQVVFGTASNTTTSATFRWDVARGMVLLDSRCQLPRGAVSHDGATLVALCTTEQGAGAYQWSEAAGFRALGAPPAGFSVELRFASADHGVLIAQGRGTGREDMQALRATAATGFVPLGALPGNPTCGLLGGSFNTFPAFRPPTNADGSVVVGTCFKSDAGTSLGFRWSKASGLVAMQPLPGHTRTWATSVSPDGLVGGTSTDGAGETEAVVWNADGEPRSIRTLLQAGGVTLGDFKIDDVVVLAGGRLLYGHGRDMAGHGRAWVALLP